ncbi:MAG: serine protease, partial [Rhodothermia bacterium]|nr:serine protease [Rhodothermia bacterium]
VEPGVVEDEGIVPLSLQAIGTGRVDTSDDGRAVFTYGWPGGTRRSTAGVRFDGARLGYDRAWVTSNAVGPGDSGGPLLNARGEVVGVVTLGTMVDSRPDVLEETVCIANDPRPALGLVNSTLGPRSLRALFADGNFRSRPYVQAFRLLAMIGRGERFGESLRSELDAFESSLAMRNSDPGLHFFRGVLYRMLGTPHVADSSFANVLDLFEEYFPAAYLLGVERFREGRLEQAADYFERTILAEPYRNLAKYGLARTLMRLHRYKEASELFRQVVSHDPDYAPAIFHLALCHLARGNQAGMAIASARLGRVSRVWQRELNRIIQNEVLHPKTLQPMPRAQIHAHSTW